MSIIYTIGYSAFKIDGFIEVLKRYGIQCIIDVRSVPYSKNYACYNREVLKETLKIAGIRYRNYADEFGARQTDKCFFSKEGYLDFKKYTKSDKFNKGYEQICKGIEMGYTFALMCAEVDPIDCHRNIMIAREFSERGFEIKNIMKSGGTQSQTEIEKRLLNKYFGERNQVSLFGDMVEEAELINNAYNLKNKEIGYRLDGREESYG